MCRQVIHELFCFHHGVLHNFWFFAHDCAEGHENGEVHSSSVIEDASDDLLHVFDIVF